MIAYGEIVRKRLKPRLFSTIIKETQATRIF